jgi:hypothetical protein
MILYKFCKKRSFCCRLFVNIVLLPLIGFGGFIPGLRCSVASFVMLQTG